MIKSNNFEKTFKVFKKHYKVIPLEIFGTDPYFTLVSTMLSSRTNDDTTLKAAKRLFIKAPDIFRLNQLTPSEVKKLIYPVGFYNTKAKHLLELSKLLINEYHGKIPNTREELMHLPGIGRKTANLVLSRAFDIPAISVDTHVHKISNLLGWVKTKTPEDTEKELVKILPKKYWKDINRLFVSIGRQYGSDKKIVEFLKKKNLTQ